MADDVSVEQTFDDLLSGNNEPFQHVEPAQSEQNHLHDFELFPPDVPYPSTDPCLTVTPTPNNSTEQNALFNSEYRFIEAHTVPTTPLPHIPSFVNPSSPFHAYAQDNMHPVHRPFLRRSFSQPPEEVTFHRAGAEGPVFIGSKPGRARHPFPPAQKTPRRREQQKPWRHHPYQEGTRPTSTPRPFLSPHGQPAMMHSESMVRHVNGHPAGPGVVHPAVMKGEDAAQEFRRAVCEVDVLEKYKFGGRSEETTLVMGLMSFVERLTAECEGMTELAQRGFAQLGNNGEGELERYVADFPSSSSRPAHILMTYSTRLECRNANSGLTELDEKLQALPLGDGYNSTEDGRMLPLLPEDGQAIRDMDHQAVEKALGAYELLFQPRMFLYEKKLLYLRFIGAGRLLMHRILD
ncbi:hypothetical protein LTS18_009655 [Coniosporium uncinatum]|uniref:Uncharacterized protein n=1 Tax=Coniosporium uncinatum TaxID=93489 RepID=A0ACC3DAC8_9PEZI|nr:hypothetical protein LTS18_009655 [Coniosporium uncinatum]